MKPDEWLALGARVIGLVWILIGLNSLLDALLLNLGYFQHPESTIGYYVIAGSFMLVLGLYFFRGAPLLVDFAYPAEEEEAEEEATDAKPAQPV